MSLKLLLKTARSASVMVEGEGPYNTSVAYDVYVNGTLKFETDVVVNNIYELLPETDYEIKFVAKDGSKEHSISITTNYEFVTLNVKDFGAKGDGVSDDTHFIQAAIMACPKDSRVLIPEGEYKITQIFFKSDVNIELAKGAKLQAYYDRDRYAILPGTIESFDETEDYNLGSWEGNPLKMFAGVVGGINASNVTLYGQGIIDGAGDHETWWKNPKIMNIAFRPRLLFINHCDNFTLQGITLMNSPSWTIHPYFSDNLKFIGTRVKNPSDSPNTDGLDPESCDNVEIVGVRFSLGDDCIAIKSGKIYMGRKTKKPSSNLHIYQCLMENGHGAVTVGSEIGGGVNGVLVENCRFYDTDRGLRIKTRRGRGKDSVLDNITFRNIEMDQVMTPFTGNAFYFCDPDGKADYVQTREPQPVTDATPYMKKFTFENIEAKNCHVAAIYFDGLPEAKIEEVVMRNVHVTFAENPKCDRPIMSSGVDNFSRKGIHLLNVKKAVLENVNVEGAVGELYEIIDCDEVIK